ncbi:MAG: sce7726 family protein [Cytophagales bacterium]|nr:sce7726 family protein [Cytophagales bacterium]
MDYSALVRSYNTLSYTNQLRDLLAEFFQTDKFQKFSKFELAKTINDIAFKNYDCEAILKYQLAKEFVTKKYVAAFEVKAKTSRTDFLVINGDTKSFEVKSKIDTLNRLKKQVDDYGDVFEYNTVVIDKSHLEKVIELIPEYYGVWYYEKSKKVIYREAKYSPKLNAKEQLSLMNKKEQQKFFGTIDNEQILNNYNAAQINLMLKQALKARYNKRWSFIQNHWEVILPIDLQFFFNTNVKPEIIYGC